MVDLERGGLAQHRRRVPVHMTVVLLALDESEASIEAARQAHRLFGSDATYLALNVAEMSPAWGPVPPVRGAVYAYPYGAPYPLVEEEIEAIPAEATLDAAREHAHELAEEAGIAAAPVGEFGDPTTAILAAADDHEADVIVVGATDKSWWRRMIDGSVANDLVRESTRPVLIAGRVPDCRRNGRPLTQDQVPQKVRYGPPPGGAGAAYVSKSGRASNGLVTTSRSRPYGTRSPTVAAASASSTR